jgi:hypothetical protein
MPRLMRATPMTPPMRKPSPTLLPTALPRFAGSFFFCGVIFLVRLCSLPLLRLCRGAPGARISVLLPWWAATWHASCAAGARCPSATTKRLVDVTERHQAMMRTRGMRDNASSAWQRFYVFMMRKYRNGHIQYPLSFSDPRSGANSNPSKYVCKLGVEQIQTYFNTCAN